MIKIRYIGEVGDNPIKIYYGYINDCLYFLHTHYKIQIKNDYYFYIIPIDRFSKCKNEDTLLNHSQIYNIKSGKIFNNMLAHANGNNNISKEDIKMIIRKYKLIEITSYQ